MPPERELAERLGCNVLTVRKGILPLVSEGLLSRRVGSGTFISKLHADENGKNPRPAVQGMDHIGVLVHTESDAYANRVLQALAKEALRQGTELRSTWTKTFDTSVLDLAWHADPPLTTVRQNFEYVGHALLKSALAQSRGKSWQSDAVPNPQLVVRESCGSRDLAAGIQIPGLDIRVEGEECLQNLERIASSAH